MKTLVEKFMTKLRTTHNNKCESLLSRTQTIRIIYYFPKGGNQRYATAVLYGHWGNILECIDATYVSIVSLRQLLPKRIGLIEDREILSRKAFDSYGTPVLLK